MQQENRGKDQREDVNTPQFRKEADVWSFCNVHW